MSDQLTGIGRRVLGHLPVWAEDEAAHIEAEGGPRRVNPETGREEGSIRSYSLEEMVVRMAEDQSSPAMSAEWLQGALEDLEKSGFAFRTDDGRWRMSRSGFDALHAPAPEAGQVPGPVTVPLNPAVAESAAQA